MTTAQMAKARNGASKGLTTSSCSPHSAISLSCCHFLTHSFSHKPHTNSCTHLHISGKYKYILYCNSKAITNKANKSRTYRSSLDCQQHKSQTWQNHIQAESADKQKPIGVCMCVRVQPLPLLLLDVGCYLKHRTCTICFFSFFLFAHSAPRMRG